MVRIPRGVFRYFADDGYRKYVHGMILPRFGYSLQHWNRVIQIRTWKEIISNNDPNCLDVLEISPGLKTVWKEMPFKSYHAVSYPEFDICRIKMERQFDMIIADNVFEHLQAPDAACQNVLGMLRPGGLFLVATPFLYRIHGSPHDYSRWTPAGLSELLIRNGFACEGLQVGSWGNLRCVKASLRHWQYLGWGRDLSNDPNLPIIVWAFAQKA